MSIITKIFGDPNKKVIDKMSVTVAAVNALEPSFEVLSDDELKAKTPYLKAKLQSGTSLDEILPEAFAAVREAARRTMKMRHYDVQIIGGLVLHSGKIAEMRTGEGKTLVATLPTYLNALAGHGVHIVTSNDYLARRDAVWMGQIYDFLGLSIGVIQNQRVSYLYDSKFQNKSAEELADSERDSLGSFKVEYEFLRPCSRREAYRADITYGTNNEFGFDYLRDNMVPDTSEMVMRPGHEMVYAIIDEVDSILIDEARTPLIISAPSNEATEQYYDYARFVRELVENTDYNVDEKLRSVALSADGIKKLEKIIGVENIYAEGGIRMVHHIEQALKARVLFRRDKEYVVEGGEVVIVDEFTGRKMPGRRYSEGLHQAIEAKESLKIQKESQTLATITFQNLFRMYKKLAGMTGTAITEAEEFGKIYNLEVVSIPTNRKDVRRDLPDRIYKTEEAKFLAVVEKVKECRAKKQPILIGTASVIKNEILSEILKAHGIPHEALNAKNHEREGEIIAQAGRPGAVTLATNMAGRGVDIKLGGVPANSEEERIVREAGGLFVLGTERHESRRIDNQLRGRAGRQGDPGETQFFVSTEDDLMRIFAGDRLRSVMTRLNIPDNVPIEQGMISKMLETAQKKVESHNFDIRKHLLEYDDVLNKHREVIYNKRRRILDSRPEATDSPSAETKTMIFEYLEKEMEFVVTEHTITRERSEWNMTEIFEHLNTITPFSPALRDELELLAKGQGSQNKLEDVEARDAIIDKILSFLKEAYENFEKTVVEATGESAAMRSLERNVLVRAIDLLWMDHLVGIDHLRAGIGLRGYAQRDPLIEYKRESYRLFQELLSSIQREVVYTIFKVRLKAEIAPNNHIPSVDIQLSGPEKDASVVDLPEPLKNKDFKIPQVGRNEPCPCNSGKKYKKCHGA